MRVLFFLPVAAFGAGVELQVQYSAIQKVLAQQMFAQDGRFWVRGNAKERCSFAYLENPVVGGHSGQIQIQAKFAGKNGANIFGLCLGPGDAFDLRILATPYIQDGSIRLKDVSVQAAKESFYSRRVREAIRENLPVKFEYKVLDEAKKIIDRVEHELPSPYQQQVTKFNVSAVSVTDAAVVLGVDFTVVVK